MKIGDTFEDHRGLRVVTAVWSYNGKPPYSVARSEPFVETLPVMLLAPNPLFR